MYQTNYLCTKFHDIFVYLLLSARHYITVCTWFGVGHKDEPKNPDKHLPVDSGPADTNNRVSKRFFQRFSRRIVPLSSCFVTMLL